jgi:hypothetical protein
MFMRAIANPQRTTLAHLLDAAGLAPGETPVTGAQELPGRTANPQRTIVTERHDDEERFAVANA